MKKVLIVAREGIIREDISEIMAVLRDFNIECFSTPHKEAIDAFKNVNPDAIIICDYAENWGSKGFETFQRFSRMIDVLKTPIIRIGLEAGSRRMHGYIRFPDYPEGRFSRKEFQKKVENFRDELKSHLM